MLLNQGVFEHQSVDFAVGDDPIDRLGLADHASGPGWEVGGEVVGNTLAQRFGLADVEDAPVCRLEQVDTGVVRNG